MPHHTAPFDRRAVEESSLRVGCVLEAFGSARRSSGLSAEEFLIFLAIGRLCVDASGVIPRMTPRTYLELSDCLDIPRETVRRKVGRLVDRGYAQITAGGVVLRDVALWLRFVATVLPETDPASGGLGAGTTERTDGVLQRSDIRFD